MNIITQNNTLINIGVLRTKDKSVSSKTSDRGFLDDFKNNRLDFPLEIHL